LISSLTKAGITILFLRIYIYNSTIIYSEEDFDVKLPETNLLLEKRSKLLEALASPVRLKIL